VSQYSFTKQHQTKAREDQKNKDLKISETNYKLSLGVSDLKGEIEAAKLDIINYTIGTHSTLP